MSALISSVRVEAKGSHDHVSVWNRGGLAGTLIVQRGDGEAVARLLGADDRQGAVTPRPEQALVCDRCGEPCCGELLPGLRGWRPIPCLHEPYVHKGCGGTMAPEVHP